MAITRGTTGFAQTTDSASEEVAFDVASGDNECTTMMVRCAAAANSAARVRIEGLHKGVAAGAGVAVLPGEREYFRLGERNGIRKMYIGGTAATTLVDWGPVAAINVARE